MITKEIKFIPLDGNQADLSKSFHRTGSWEEVSEEVAIWLELKMREVFFDKILVAILSGDTVIPDNRVTRHKQIKLRKHLSYFLEMGCEQIESGASYINGKMLVYDLIQINKNNLSAIINNFGSHRQNYLMMVNPEFVHTANVNRFMASFGEVIGNNISSRGYNEFGVIDNLLLVNWLIEHQTMPIRIWGDFDDLEMTIEIYQKKQTFPTH
jgi:hypothetical protein